MFAIFVALIPIYLPSRDISLKTTTTTTTAAIVFEENPSFLFDFLNANSGVSIGGGGRTVAATVGRNVHSTIDNPYLSLGL